MTNKPDSEYVLGIDISRWDVIQNDYTNIITSLWNPDNSIKRIDFVIQKCSDGKYPDKFVNELYEQTLKIPVRAAYHYFRSGLGWKVQLDAILSSTKNKLYHFYAIDYEKFYNTLNATSFAEMMELVKQLKIATGKKVIIYFNSDIYQNNMKPYNVDSVINLVDGCWFAQYPYKIFLDLNNLPTALPKNIKNCVLWQFAGDTWGTRGFGEGKDWGSPAKSMDINIWQGSLEELYIWANIDNIEIPPIDPDPTSKETINGIVSIDKLNVRIGASTTFPLSTTILPFKKNDKVTLVTPFTHDSSNNIWSKVDDVYNNWICLRYNNVWYVNLIDNHTSFTVPSEGEFVQTLHDYQGEEYNFKPRSIVKKTSMSLPETINLIGNKPNDFFSLNEEWQRFVFALLVKANNGIRNDSEMLTAWLNFTVDKLAFTDFHSWSNGFHEYITGKNPTDKNMSFKSLTTGGNLLKVINREGNKLYVEALDLLKSPPKVEDVWDKPWLIHWCTQETITKLSDGSYKVIRFPQLSPLGTPLPVFSYGGVNIVTTDLVHSVENGKVYNIYNL